MKTSKKTIVSLLLAATFGLSIAGATPGFGAAQPNEIMWRPIEERSIDQSAKRDIIPLLYRTVRLDKETLTQALATAPMEFTRPSTENPIIHLPMPDGTMARFRFEESPVVEPGLAAKYPGLKTYRAQGLDDPTATSRFDWLPNGFHAIILTPSGTVRIDPYAKGNTTDYITYWKNDAADVARPFQCHLNEAGGPQLQRAGDPQLSVVSGTQLRTYRLALAATHEYTVFLDGPNSNVSDVLTVEVQIMNAVNAIFEREVAIRMVIIANNNLITYASDALCGGVPCTNLNDPYTNCASTLGQNTPVINAVIGKDNYDIGHLLNAEFETSPGVFEGCGGGGASFACVCNDAGKGAARTGHVQPSFIFTIAHEMGHQFDAHHSWNGCGQPLSASGYEVGSGITVMSYAGLCGGGQDLVLLGSNLDMFNVKSLEEIISFSTGAGNACAAITNTGNTPPNVSVNSPGSWTIPKETPFTLSVVLNSMRGTEDTDDVAPETITYDWEEYDLDPVWAQPGVPNSDADGHARPIFRIYPPTELLTRTFPKSKFILDNANVPPDTYDCGIPGYPPTCLTGERLSQMRGRTMQFKVVARDNNAASGGINTANATVIIDSRALPFAVLSPNTNITVQRLSSLTVTWSPTGNAANVNISLSTNGGKTFPYTLLASTPNDGSQSVLIPDVTTGYARIKVAANLNIYFDISNANFTITQ